MGSYLLFVTDTTDGVRCNFVPDLMQTNPYLYFQGIFMHFVGVFSMFLGDFYLILNPRILSMKKVYKYQVLEV